MGLHTNLTIGNGRGTCMLCKMKIKKGEKQITVEGFRTSGRIHFNTNMCLGKIGDINEK